MSMRILGRCGAITLSVGLILGCAAHGGEATEIHVSTNDAGSVDAQSAGNVDFPRYPSINPDGSRIAFSWRGDLWTANTAGGQASRLTTHDGIETYSAWSPDGTRIAFTSGRNGFNNLYIVNADGTNLHQISDTDRSLALYDFGVNNDGNEVLYFGAFLEGDVYRSPRPYMISVDGGVMERVHGAFGRSPASSEDGSKITFTRGGSSWARRHYRGPDSRDVWTYDTAADSYEQLTHWEGNDGYAKWIGNDKIVFASDRNLDCVNLYVMDASKGDKNARQLTAFDSRDVWGFDVSANGTTAVVAVWDTLYSLDLTQRGSTPEALALTAIEDENDNFELHAIDRDVSEAALSPDGQVMAYIAYGEVYIRNIDDDSPTQRVTRSHAREREIAWSPDGLSLYFSSDRDGSDSIYAANVTLTRGEIMEDFENATNPPKPEVEERDDDDDESDDENADDDNEDDGGKKQAVEVPAGDGITGSWSGKVSLPEQGDLAFNMTLKLGSDGTVTGRIESQHYSGSVIGSYTESGELKLTMALDDGTNAELTLKVSDGSMTGQVVAGGMTAPMTATRDSTTTDNDDAKDGDDKGKSEKEDEEKELPKELQADRWHDAIRFVITPVLADPNFEDRDVRFAPDGKSFLFRRGRGDMMVHSLDTKENRLLVSGWDRGIEGQWSPDGKYVAYAQSDMDFNSDVWIVTADGSSNPINISRHPNNDYRPRWSHDGKVMTFLSERVNNEMDVWMVYLDRDLQGMLPPELKEYYEEQAKAVKKLKPVKVEQPETDDVEDEEAEEDEEKSDDDDGSAEDADADELELEDAYLRVRRMTSMRGNEGNLEITPAGDRLIFTAGGPESGLHSIKWDGSDRKRLTSNVSVQHLNLTGDKIVYVSGGTAGTVGPAGGSTNSYAIQDRIRIDLEKQSSQKFNEATRTLGMLFYHPDMKGLDWDQLSSDYHDLAKHARTSDEFDYIAARILGELNGSHLGVYSSGESMENVESLGYLGTTHNAVQVEIAGAQPEDDQRLVTGFEITEIVPQGPTANGEMALQIGDVITAIELEEFEATDTVESRLKGRSNKETILTIQRMMPAPIAEDQDQNEGEGDDVEAVDVLTSLNILVRPISFGQQSNLKYEQWRNTNAKKVSDWSNGRIGYIHVKGMNQSSLDVFERDLFAAAGDKDGLLIDVRNNGGGWTADLLLASITVQPHAYTIPRGADSTKTGHYPQDRLFIARYTLPANMLCNEKSFSNAEIVSHAFKHLKRGNLVGEQTYGGVISTSGFGLIDGTFVRLPFRGWYLMDGSDMENNGAMPDIVVHQTPEAESANEDAQLRAAVDDLLKRVKDN